MNVELVSTYEYAKLDPAQIQKICETNKYMCILLDNKSKAPQTILVGNVKQPHIPGHKETMTIYPRIL
jgi:hypothetical protein